MRSQQAELYLLMEHGCRGRVMERDRIKERNSARANPEG